MSENVHSKTHIRTCNLCEAMCGLEIQYEDQKVLSIRGDKNDPLSRGHICPKALGLKDIYEDPDRLKFPIQKTANGWQQLSWEAAFQLAAERIQQTQEAHGRDAVATYLGNPNVHNIGSLLSLGSLSYVLKSKNRYSATSADQLPHHFASFLMFGHYFLLPIPDIDHTDYMLILGANPIASNGSIMTVPDVAHRLKAIQQRGGKVIVIDPRKTETAAIADEHLFVHPGKDILLLLAMVHTLFEEQLVQLGQLESILDGLEDVRKSVVNFGPERVAEEVGINAEKIRALSRAFAQADAAVCYGRMGLSTQAFGGLCQWLINLMNILTGNLDSVGGAMFTKPAFDYIARGKKGSIGKWTSRVRGTPEFGGELPVAVLAEEMLTEGEGQIKALITSAGNPILSTPNGQQLRTAFEQLDFYVAIDIYLNESTQYADLILPPATGLEVPHYDLVFNALAVRNSANYSAPLFEKEAGMLHDWEIVKGLVEALGGDTSRIVPPEMAIGFALQHGPYQKEGLTFEKLVEHPSGIDLGPLSPCLPERLFTADKRIQLAPELMLNDLPRAEALLDKPIKNTHPFSLIGRRHLRSNNSWMHNSHRLIKGPNRCTLMMHPEDCASLGLIKGQEVKISSRVGSIQLPLEPTEEMMPGVVSIPHGFGHRSKDIKMRIASEHAGASINDLTDDLLLDELTGNAAFSGVAVSVEAIEPA